MPQTEPHPWEYSKIKRMLIIGGGFAGCAVAMMLKGQKDYDITLVDSAPMVGAGVRTYFYGGHPFTFGPRHFLTKEEWIFDYLNSIVPMRRCVEHEFLTYIEKDQQFYSYPIHEDDVAIMPEAEIIAQELASTKAQQSPAPKTLEEYWVSSVGPTLYHKFIASYSKKMWQVRNNNEIDDFGWSPKGTSLKTGPRAAWDTAISAYPLAVDGYNQFFDIACEDINLRLETAIQEFDLDNKSVIIDGEKENYDIIVNTISPDIIYNFCFGELPYMGRDIIKLVLPVEFALPKDVYFAYYSSDEVYTRVTEYKKFSQYKSKDTLISIEIPSSNGRHYPMPFKIEYDRAQKYFDLMQDGIFSIGRAGSYRYEVDIDDCISQARDVCRMLGV